MPRWSPRFHLALTVLLILEISASISRVPFTRHKKSEKSFIKKFLREDQNKLRLRKSRTKASNFNIQPSSDHKMRHGNHHRQFLEKIHPEDTSYIGEGNDQNSSESYLVLPDDVRTVKSVDTRSVNITSTERTKFEIPDFVAELPDTMDIVTKFLKFVEKQTMLGENCTAGTDMYLGEGIVDHYTQERFRIEAEFTVTRANLLTRLWKRAPKAAEIDSVLYVLVQELLEFSDTIHAAGNCYDAEMNKEYYLFCPFATRMPNGTNMVKDLSREYHYLTNQSTWFLNARQKGKDIASNPGSRIVTGYVKPRKGDVYGDVAVDEILKVKYEDGEWSQPYYDCGGGNVWMMSYMVPFFGYANDSYYFKGTSGIDIDLRRVDIDQCPETSFDSHGSNVFAGSDKCKNKTTMCEFIPGLGFRRGSYNCVCKRGYYFPDSKSNTRYYNGTEVEQEYEKKLMQLPNIYDDYGSFECVMCPEGCETCIDDRPCLLALNWVQRNIILGLTSCIMCSLFIVLYLLWIYSEVKVIKAASPVLLRIIILGAFLLYSTILVMYPKPTALTCTLKIWLREVGFFIGYGALMLKTWRISVVFRVRSAKAIKITDLDLIKRLGLIVLVVMVFLSVRTTVATPHVITEKSHDDLKAFLCSTDWWDYAFTGLEIMFLVWGIGLCYVVRKAPSEFNESRYISLAIYNEFFLSIFLVISMIFLHSPANPDLQFWISFGHNQLTITLLLCLIFGSKVYMVFKGQQENNQDRSTAAGSVCVGKIMSKNKRASNNCKERFSSSSSAHCHSNEEGVVHIEDIKEEFDRLYSQLQMLKNKNMRLGNRHLVERINEMHSVVNSNRWKLFASAGKCPNDSNTQISLTNYSRNFLTPEIPNHTVPNADQVLESEATEPFINKDVVKGSIHDQCEDAISEKATSSGVNLDQISLRSRQSSSRRSERSYSAASAGGDSNQNFSEIQPDQSSLKQNFPKARNIVINLDDPEYFTQELTV